MIAQVYSDDNIEVYRFLSTDEKPLSCKHGSRALEIDTGRKYIFDAENSIWQEVHDSDEDRPVDAYTKEETQALLLTKVDKVSGMGLSQESYTTAEKQKLAGIEAGATAVTVDSALSSTSTNPVQNQAVYADKQKQDAVLAEVENKGAKNLLPLTGESTDIFTINADGTMTANGPSSTSKRDFAYYIGAPPKGRFVFSGCPPTGSNTTYRMFLQSVVGSTYTTLATLTGDPVEVDLTDIDKIRVLMSIYGGYAPNNIKFSPMLCTKSEWDISHTYVPYGKTNAELTAENTSQQSEIDSQQSEIDYVVNAGVKNIAPVNSGSGTSVNLFNRSCFVSAGQYILSYKASDFSGNYELAFYDATDTYISGSLNGPITATKSVEFRLRADAYRMRFSILGTATITELMLRPAAITDPTYEPYALPNPTLTPAAIKAVDEGGKNIADMSKSTTGSTSLITRDGDTVTIIGTSPSSGNAWYNVFYAGIDKLLIPPGTYIAMLTNINNNLKLRASIQSGTIKEGAWGQQAIEFTIPSGATGSWVRFDYKLNTAYNISFKLMICTAADWAVSQKFVPYCPANRELYEEKIGIEDAFGSGTQILTNGTADITEIGNFYCQNADTAATVTNAPWTDSGFFGFVRRSVLPSERFIQIAFKNNDVMAIAKRRYTGTWQPWAYSSSEPRSAGNYIMSYADSLPTPGVYFAYHIAGSGIDKPVSGHRYMYQIMMMSSTYGCIHAYELDPSSGAVMYIANKINGTWSSWYKIEGAPLT